MDRQDEFLGLTDTTVLFDNNQAESLLYILGLLNSRLLTFRFRSIGKLKSGGIYEYFWNSVSKLPIRRINFSDQAEKAQHDRVVELVESMLALNEELAATESAAHTDVTQRRIDATDCEIDRLVYALYGLTTAEITIVEMRRDKSAPRRFASEKFLASKND